MKKKKRFFAFALSCLALVLGGCSLDDGVETADLDGVKTLSRSSDNLSDAVGDYSTNFFNLFSKNVLELLYDVYENPTSLSDTERNTLFASTFNHLSGEKGTLDSTGFTYDDYLASQSGTDIYYLFDSIRFTISSATTGTDATSDPAIVTLNTATDWNWSVSYYPTVFEKAGLSFSANSVTLSGYTTFEAFMADNLSNLPDFSAQYHSDTSAQNANGKVDYYASPYYSGTTYSNYYQDILEYVTYLTVLGCDPDDADYEDYFDIKISKNSLTGKVESVSVGGWSSSEISLLGENGALAQVKNVYEKTAEYVGLTDADRAQIVEFILEEVIGSAATASDSFSVGSTTYQRNYAEMVARIVDYASMLVPVGDNADGSNVTLAEPFVLGQITDYNGSYFFTNEDSTGNGTFEYITAQEFQSVVIRPTTDDVNQDESVGMIGLEFLYGGDGGTGYADSITLDVGVRFYRRSTKTVTDFGTAKVTLCSALSADFDSQENYYAITNDPAGEMANLLQLGDTDFSSAVLTDGRIEGCFNTSIGSDAINAIKNGTIKAGTDNNVASMKITSSTSAKNYYSVNKSSSATYATLNQAMFSGDDGCDFFEIYFNIEKTGSLSEIASTNYNFQVALYWFSLDGSLS